MKFLLFTYHSTTIRYYNRIITQLQQRFIARKGRNAKKFRFLSYCRLVKIPKDFFHSSTHSNNLQCSIVLIFLVPVALPASCCLFYFPKWISMTFESYLGYTKLSLSPSLCFLEGDTKAKFLLQKEKANQMC